MRLKLGNQILIRAKSEYSLSQNSEIKLTALD